MTATAAESTAEKQETPVSLSRGSLTLDDIRDRATINLEETAAVLGISRLTAYAHARTGDTFPVKRIGKRWIVPVPALIAWLSER